MIVAHFIEIWAINRYGLQSYILFVYETEYRALFNEMK
jgi:hypothetical protein